MRCTKCKRSPGEDEQLDWECVSCHTKSKSNLNIFRQIAAKKAEGFEGAIAKCPVCDNTLDDGKEKIIWKCKFCGQENVGNMDEFLADDGAEEIKEKKSIVDEIGKATEVNVLNEEIPDDVFGTNIFDKNTPTSHAETEAPEVKADGQPDSSDDPTANIMEKPATEISVDTSNESATETESETDADKSSDDEKSTTFTLDDLDNGDKDKKDKKIKKDKKNKKDKKERKSPVPVIATIMIVALLGVGGFVVFREISSPKNQFKKALKSGDYDNALIIYNNKIKGDESNEKIAKIATEKKLSDAYELYKSGSGEDDYKKILEFADDDIGVDTEKYEDKGSDDVGEDGNNAVTASPTPEPVNPLNDPSSPGYDPASDNTRPDYNPATDPRGMTDPSVFNADAVLAWSENAVNDKDYIAAYNYLSFYTGVDTSGVILERMGQLEEKYRKQVSKGFDKICKKLTIASGKDGKFNVVPKTFKPDYKQIAGSRDVGGIVYVDPASQTVELKKIKTKSTMSAKGKKNRAYLEEFVYYLQNYTFLYETILSRGTSSD